MQDSCILDNLGSLENEDETTKIARSKWHQKRNSAASKIPDLFEDIGLGPACDNIPKPPQSRRPASPHDRLKAGRFWGLSVTREIAGIMVGYMAQGTMTGGHLAIQYYFKDVLNVGPVQLATIKGLLALPWLVRPLYGLVSDSWPFFGYFRRSYLVISGILACVLYMVWSLQAQSVSFAAGLWMMATFCTAMMHVILDGVSCEMGRGVSQAKAGALQSLCRLSFAFGALIVACLTGYLIEAIGSRIVIFIMGFFSLFSCIAGFMISDTPGGGEPYADPSAYKTLKTIQLSPDIPQLVTNKDAAEETHPNVNPLRRPRTRMQRILKSMWSAIKQRRVLQPVIFIVIFMATPQTSNAMFFFYINALGFTPAFLANMTILARAADVASTLIYARFFRNVGIRKLFFWTPILAAVLGLSQVILVTRFNRILLIPDKWFVFGDTIFVETVSRIALLHLMVLCSNLCPAGCESTMFAVIMACASTAYLGIGNLGGSILMYLFGVTSTNFSNLALMVVTCNLLHLACLPFLGMIPRNVEPTVRPEFRPRHQGNAEDGRLLFEAGDGGHQEGGLCAYILPDSALGFEQKVSHMEVEFDLINSGMNRDQLHRKLRHMERHSGTTCTTSASTLPESARLLFVNAYNSYDGAAAI